MRLTLQLISGLALAGTILPPIAFAAEGIDAGGMKLAMLAATVTWFAVTPFWMGRPTAADPPS